MTKPTVHQLQPGDEVVIHTGSALQPYIIGKVQKVTATQITVNGERYSKQTKTRIGDRDNWGRKQTLAETWRDGLMTVADANRKNEEVAREWEVKVLVHKIKDTHNSKLAKLPVDLLKQVVEMLEQADE